LVELVLTKGQITAALVAAELDTSVQNASTRLKKLVDQGYFMRSEVVADSGGIEYIYQAIK
jgi:predicted transcriptional regulator